MGRYQSMRAYQLGYSRQDTYIDDSSSTMFGFGWEQQSFSVTCGVQDFHMSVDAADRGLQVILHLARRRTCVDGMVGRSSRKGCQASIARRPLCFSTVNPIHFPAGLAWSLQCSAVQRSAVQ